MKYVCMIHKNIRADKTPIKTTLSKLKSSLTKRWKLLKTTQCDIIYYFSSMRTHCVLAPGLMRNTQTIVYQSSRKRGNIIHHP